MKMQKPPVRIYSLEEKRLKRDDSNRKKRPSKFRQAANRSFEEDRRGSATKIAAARSMARRRASQLARDITRASVDSQRSVLKTLSSVKEMVEVVKTMQSVSPLDGDWPPSYPVYFEMPRQDAARESEGILRWGWRRY